MKGYQSEHLLPINSANLANLAASDNALVNNFDGEGCRGVDDPKKLLAQYLRLSQVCDRQSSKIKNLETAFEYSEHQLRHLLSLIALYAENLYLGLSDHPLQEQAEILKGTTQQLRQHLNRLTTIKQQQQVNTRSVDLRTIFQASIRDLSLMISEKQLTIDYTDSKAVAQVDSWQIKQVFDNLLHNAIHFAPKASKINCTWQVFQQEMLIEISDRGCGFSQSALEQALTPHYSTREDGTGLGLAIANQIILAHQGRLWLDNLPDGGALVSFILPRNLTVNS